jgi:hypothetical protein
MRQAAIGQPWLAARARGEGSMRAIPSFVVQGGGNDAAGAAHRSTPAGGAFRRDDALH